MKRNIIFQSVLMIVGAIIIVINSSWWLLLGIFLALWGNNIQIDNDIKRDIQKIFEPKDE